MVKVIQRAVCFGKDRYMYAPQNQFKSKAESAHARLKLYLGDTMSSLQTSFDKIEKMLKNQFGEIKKLFEKSMNIPRHKQLRNCTIKITHRLPCMHDLAYYRSISTPIPLCGIHTHWIRLSMHANEFNDERTRPDRTS
ncbi:hypothetical protein RHMOL_Rhmol02G0229800 [Rhododendron molle]|uniref:Uncharacterized protein n=1 Tax=Rhododendron molle TaxID=49168 RepID=A0ACC0PSU7_RHOML|nr:hypothetical protein RHMOL_Rhmol02G0229800 [Rhododendron molle]